MGLPQQGSFGMNLSGAIPGEIHRLRSPALVYDLDTGEPCGRVDCHGRVLPLLPPVTHSEDIPAKNEVEVEILDD